MNKNSHLVVIILSMMVMFTLTSCGFAQSTSEAIGNLLPEETFVVDEKTDTETNTEVLTTVSVTEEKIPEQKMAEAYLNKLKEYQADIRDQEVIFAGSDTFMGRIIIADLIGDSLPELIYTTTSNETDTGFVSMSETITYNRKVEFHLATFDKDSDEVIDVYSVPSQFLDAEDHYYGLLSARATYYHMDGINKLYELTGQNLSGVVGIYYEYTYNEKTKKLDTTDSYRYENWGSEDEIDNANIKTIYQNRNADSGSDMRIIDLYLGKTFLEDMSYDDAIAYLQGVAENTGGLMQERDTSFEEYSDNLVIDAYKSEKTYSKGQNTAAYAIPQINLESAKIENINDEIYELLYPEIKKAEEKIAETDSVAGISMGISYQWTALDDLLSLVICKDPVGDSDGGGNYYVYNVSVSDVAQVPDETVYQAAGFMQEEYYQKAGDGGKFLRLSLQEPGCRLRITGSFSIFGFAWL